MVIDFRNRNPSYNDIVIKGELVDKVDSNNYKYLCITIDNKLSWKQNIYSIIRKTHS